MDVAEIDSLKTTRAELMRARRRVVDDLRVRVGAWSELRELCQEIWEIDRKLGALPELPARASQTAVSPVAAEPNQAA